jgi:drug/metabolite transporter (DMT)-like permease
MAEVILWTVLFTIATVVSILLMGSRAIVGGTIDLPRMAAILVDWHFVVGVVFAFFARVCFLLVNNSLLRVPGLDAGATTITAFITSIALIGVVAANYLFLDERLTPMQIVGAIVILVGIVLMTVRA